MGMGHGAWLANPSMPTSTSTSTSISCPTHRQNGNLRITKKQGRGKQDREKGKRKGGKDRKEKGTTPPPPIYGDWKMPKCRRFPPSSIKLSRRSCELCHPTGRFCIDRGRRGEKKKGPATSPRVALASSYTASMKEFSRFCLFVPAG